MRPGSTHIPTRASALAQTTGGDGAPVTMTERKRQVIRWAADRRLDYGSSKIARLAGRVQKHDPAMSAQHAAEFLDSHTGIVSAGRVHTHADPTPAEALHHMHGNVPCARCEWQPDGWEPDWAPEIRRKR